MYENKKGFFEKHRYYAFAKILGLLLDSFIISYINNN